MSQFQYRLQDYCPYFSAKKKADGIKKPVTGGGPKLPRLNEIDEAVLMTIDTSTLNGLVEGTDSACLGKSSHN